MTTPSTIDLKCPFLSKKVGKCPFLSEKVKKCPFLSNMTYPEGTCHCNEKGENCMCNAECDKGCENQNCKEYKNKNLSIDKKDNLFFPPP